MKRMVGSVLLLILLSACGNERLQNKSPLYDNETLNMASEAKRQTTEKILPYGEWEIVGYLESQNFFNREKAETYVGTVYQIDESQITVNGSSIVENPDYQITIYGGDEFVDDFKEYWGIEEQAEITSSSNLLIHIQLKEHENYFELNGIEYSTLFYLKDERTMYLLEYCAGILILEKND